MGGPVRLSVRQMRDVDGAWITAVKGCHITLFSNDHLLRFIMLKIKLCRDRAPRMS